MWSVPHVVVAVSIYHEEKKRWKKYILSPPHLLPHIFMHVVCQFNSSIVLAKLDTSRSVQRCVSTLISSNSPLTCLKVQTILHDDSYTPSSLSSLTAK